MMDQRRGFHGISAATLAHTGMDDNDASVLASMVKLLKNRTSLDWQIGPPERADVLVVGSHANEDQLQAWQASGKVWIAVICPHETRPLTPHTLQLPIRVFPLLSLLTELEQLPQLQSRSRVARASAIEAPNADTQWRFAQRLRKMALSIEHGKWLRIDSIYLRDDARFFAADEVTISKLRSGPMKWSGQELTVARPPDGLLTVPVDELAWFVGWWADGQKLAPWLDKNHSYRLRHWPDFGSLRGSQLQFRMAALIAARAWTVDELVHSRGLSAESVIRFLNAASLSGALIACTAAATPMPPKPAGFMAGLVKNIRSRLGLGNAEPAEAQHG